MPKNRIILTLVMALAIPLVAWAQDPPAPLEALPGADVAAKPKAAPEAPPTPAEATIDEAVKKIKAITTVSADLNVTADMINQKFGLKGQYIKAPGHKFYMLLSLVGLGDTRGTMLQVCDGVTLWDFTRVLDSQRCERWGFNLILKVLNRPDCDASLRETVLSRLGFTGPEALLSGLRKAFVFDQMREGEFDGKPVWILGGTWRDGVAPVMPSGPNGAPLNLNGGPIPPYVPSLVSVYLGREDGWPYQVIFEGRKPTQIETGKKKAETKLDGLGRPISKKLVTPAGEPSKIVMVYSNVKLNAVIPDSTFAFSPPDDVKPEDLTDSTVAQLEQAITELANRKRAEAAKTEGPVLDGSLPVPVPPAEAPK